MDDNWLAQRFDESRTHLKAVAYRMLGSASEAEDAVQEAWLRLSRSDTDALANVGGWLTTVVGRVCLDMLRARRSRREDYAGSWLPEPIVTIDPGADPEQEALLADSVGLALRPITGAPAVARGVLARGSRFAPLARPAIVNGAAGLVVGTGSKVRAVVGINVVAGRIAAIDLITDARKLRGLVRQEAPR